MPQKAVSSSLKTMNSVNSINNGSSVNGIRVKRVYIKAVYTGDATSIANDVFKFPLYGNCLACIFGGCAFLAVVHFWRLCIFGGCAFCILQYLLEELPRV